MIHLTTPQPFSQSSFVCICPTPFPQPSLSDGLSCCQLLVQLSVGCQFLTQSTGRLLLRLCFLNQPVTLLSAVSSVCFQSVPSACHLPYYLSCHLSLPHQNVSSSTSTAFLLCCILCLLLCLLFLIPCLLRFLCLLLCLIPCRLIRGCPC